MTNRCAHKTPPVAALLSVGLWRNRATGEETGDIVIHYERNRQTYRLRLSDTDAQHLADSIIATRATAARRRERLASGANLISLELTFPAGLISFFQIQSGAQQVMQQGPWTVNFRVQARPASSESWTVLGDWAVSGVQQHQLIATWEWEPPTAESYFVRFYRLDQDWDFIDQSAQEWRVISRSIWTALRTYRYRYPVNFKKPMSLVAVDSSASTGSIRIGISSISRRRNGASSRARSGRRCAPIAIAIPSTSRSR